MDDVANVEQAESGDTVERGNQRGIAELSLGIFDGRLVAFDLRVEFLDRGLLVVELLMCDGILVGETSCTAPDLAAHF